MCWMLFNNFLPFISGETLAAKSEGRDGGEAQDEAAEDGERSGGGSSAEASATSASPASATATPTFVLASLLAVAIIVICA